MATQSYIFHVEQAVLDETLTWDLAEQAVDAFRYERDFNGGSPHEENRDAWATLWLNVRQKIERFPDWLGLYRALEHYFGS